MGDYALKKRRQASSGGTDESGQAEIVLQHIHIHENKMTDTAAHNKQVENLMTAKVGRELLENLQL